MSSTYIPNIEGATAEEAGRNIIEFTKDCEKASGVFPITVERREYMDCGGRYGFILEHGGVFHYVQMPGLPLEKVRWMNTEGKWVQGREQNVKH